MKILFSDTHSYEKEAFLALNSGLDFQFLDFRIHSESVAAIPPCEVVVGFVNDHYDRFCLQALASKGVKLIALRCAGFNNVDLKTAEELGIKISRVPAYSPHAVAEHALALLLTLNRKTHRAYQRVRELNFSLEGLVGFDLYHKTVGVIGTGKIGTIFASIMMGMGCRVLAVDLNESSELKQKGIEYVTRDQLLKESDVISLHVPLNDKTFHMMNDESFLKMKKNAILVNTGRGGLVDTKALIQALKKGQIAGAALDVYEEEEGVFFEDRSDKVLTDDILARLLTFPNVLLTSHQGFLTSEALHNIAQTTVLNIREFQQGRWGNPVQS
jgi:D-lactate dehydrogenase